MGHSRFFRCAALMMLVTGLPATAQIYERATQGPIGNTSGGGLAVDNQFYSGWRFEVPNGPVQTTSIGGHFFQATGAVFGAIVRLTGPNDDPDDFTLNGADVLARNVFDLPHTGGSNVAQGPMNLTLQNGWYLVIFGSGAFGATSTFGGLFAQEPTTAVPGAQLNITYRQFPTQAVFLQASVCRVFVEYTTGTAPCYPNCDNSTVVPVLNVQDFSCFLNRFTNGETYANCDGSTTPPVLNVQDFSCFLNRFTVGCS